MGRDGPSSDLDFSISFHPVQLGFLGEAVFFFFKAVPCSHAAALCNKRVYTGV